jgi:dihydrofolate reductase
MTISLIAVIGQNNEIGFRNKLLVHLSADLKRFKSITTGHTVIMGQKTFESIGGKALPNRRNIVISDIKGYLAEGASVIDSIEGALMLTQNDGEVFIIGGASVYKQFLPLADKMYLTCIHKNFMADAFFPEFDWNDWKTIEQCDIRHDKDAGVEYSFITLVRKKK